MKPKAPQMHGTIKLHKEHKPIRPIVSWRNSPGYKLAKYIATQLSEKIQLPYIYNVEDY
jgi:sugar (pentulose or hexulose) kinase